MKKRITFEGQPCRKCQTAVVKKTPNYRKSNKLYRYEYYLYCPGCGTIYFQPDARVFLTSGDDAKKDRLE